MKLGIIVGGGDLPKHVVEASSHDDHDLTIIALAGFADASVFDGAKIARVAEYGKIVKILKTANCTHLCFAGIVNRPDFKALKPDLRGMLHMGGAIKAAKNGDDSLIRYLLTLFEKEGFVIVPPQELCQSLLLPEGFLGAVKIDKAHSEDIRKACEIALKIGALDIGQGAVVARGVVLAVEAQEGTDLMLERLKSLPQNIKGTADSRIGVLAKMLKPGQDTRVDLPTIGPMTVKKAAEAGLAGIVAEGGRAFILDRTNVIELADEAGIFVAGLPQS